ncbi:MAG: DNA mismatch repair endonuclease MutL, partial [Eudoraea sp.]|nr:DNA mismatch repair endonuclease MutL [Eudoraea sp.]
MADIIQLLPDHVANQIAAGEVVQRPASVVKELLENAIDAGATSVKLIIKESGKTLIQVIDDGFGMSPTDARLSFERHATSKIKSAKDLFHINTKGFRGEALASIAAIAHVEMQTRQASEELGSAIRIEGSKLISQDVIASPKGTSIAVKNLFFNIPARRNFLKSNQVELRHITDEFHRVALAHPRVSFHFYNNGSEIFNLASASHRKRIVNIFGSRANEKLVPVEEDTQVVKISGFICKPQFAKKSRGEQFFFVNNRFIKSPYLYHAVVNAFEGIIKPDTHPGYFLYL